MEYLEANYYDFKLFSTNWISYKREKKAYKSNPNIKLELTKDNIELVSLKEKYVKGFHNITKEYRKQHEENAKKLCNINELNGIYEIYASNSSRAIETAKYLAESNNLKIKLDKK